MSVKDETATLKPLDELSRHLCGIYQLLRKYGRMSGEVVKLWDQFPRINQWDKARGKSHTSKACCGVVLLR